MPPQQRLVPGNIWLMLLLLLTEICGAYAVGYSFPCVRYTGTGGSIHGAFVGHFGRTLRGLHPSITSTRCRKSCPTSMIKSANVRKILQRLKFPHPAASLPPAPSASSTCLEGGRGVEVQVGGTVESEEARDRDGWSMASGEGPHTNLQGLPVEYVGITEPPKFAAESDPLPIPLNPSQSVDLPSYGHESWQVLDPRLSGQSSSTPTPFVDMFRGSAPYISMHRGSIMVLHIPGDIIGTPAFEKTLDDVALMALLGVKIVIVCGVAHQVDRRLRSADTAPRYCGDVRITDAETLRLVKDEAGFARCEIESILSRGFKGRPGAMGIEVVSGNFFYSAKPYGVIDGIDFGYTGEVRKVETDNIMKRLDQGDVVLLTILGYSASGQTFNVVSEHLAAEASAALQANKLIFITEGQTLVDTRTKHVIQSMRLKDAKALLQHHNVILHPASVTDGCMVEGRPFITDIRPSDFDYEKAILRFTRYSVQALDKGVSRAHLIAPGNGRLLQELFTRDGAGTLISRDLYDGIRPASVADVPGILDIVDPLIQDGILMHRSRKELENDINQYYVFTRDGLVLACGQLRKFDSMAEIGCLCVHPKYRRGGRGDAILGFLERVAVNSGLTTMFVLSTRTMQWFCERGFEEVVVEALPPSRYAVYNWQRRSKIYMKSLQTSRDLDAEELFWNVTPQA